MAREQRRLAAIVSADVAGFSRLMERDESVTLARLKSLRRDVIDPRIAEYGGRIVKSMGDGLLLEFPSVVEAVRCSVDVQRDVEASDGEGVPERRIRFRVGINVGDIIIDGDDIYGDGVNVAARLQALAEPGGICVSRAVRDQVLDKLSFTFADLGAQTVKNIARPVEAYRVVDALPSSRQAPPAAAPAARAGNARGSRAWMWGAGVIVVAVALAAGAWWWLPRTSGPTSGPASLSVAILPFAPTADAPADDALADALTRDVTAALVRSERRAVVISDRVAVAYKGKAVDARRVGQELAVRYVVEGRLRSGSDRIELDVELVDATTGTHAWRGRFATAPGETEALVVRTTQQLRIALNAAEAQRVGSGEAPARSADALVARANAIATYSLDRTREAGKLLDEALRLEPNNVAALDARTWNLFVEHELDARADHDAVLARMDELTRRAVELGYDDASVWLTRGIVIGWRGRGGAEFEALARARRLDPARKSIDDWLAWATALNGKPEEALAILAESRRRLPDDDPLDWRMAGFFNVLLGRNDEAIVQGERAAGMGSWYWDHVVLAAAYANKGDAAKAAAAAAEVRKLVPGYSIAVVKSRRYSDHPAYVEMAERYFYPGLRKAGIPER